MTVKPPLAVVVKGWPRLSETFIAQELAGLENKGIAFDIWSLRHPTDKKTHPLHDVIRARVRYLPEYLHQEPMRVARAWFRARQLPGFSAAAQLWRHDLARDRSRNRWRRFGQACVLASEAGPEMAGLYAHFLHTPSSVARYAAVMRGLPWAFSAHAKDIWTSEDWELTEKLTDGPGGATFGVTCTAFGARFLKDTAAQPDRVSLLYHGLDLSRFPDPPNRTGSPVFRMLSVGRLVEKKGFDRLLDAFAALPGDFDWHWVHVGGGGLGKALRAQADRLGITRRITWRGPCDQPEVISAMGNADLFVLPSRVASDGDRDGLPNVLMEAASQLLPILSTPVSAIPEFIDDGVHGTLVPDTPADLAEAIIRLANNPDHRAGMAQTAFDRLRAEFGAEAGITRLADQLRSLIHGAQ
ncbi:MAG: glycosyltransferase family 4 protein [Pseudomonadota bacterium]